MGVLDELTDALNRGSSTVERAARSKRLKSELDDVNKRRQSFAAQLGASLYEATRELEEYRVGRESLYEEIERCDKERIRINEQIAEIQRRAEEEEASRQLFKCSDCGSIIRGGDLFCTGCGASFDSTQINGTGSVSSGHASSEQDLVCRSCGSPIGNGNAFCIICGAPVLPQVIVEVQQASTSLEVDLIDPHADEVTRCEKCGAPFDEDQAFCIECGAAIQMQNPPSDRNAVEDISTNDETKASHFCPKCGSCTEVDQLFCSICGASLSR